MTAPWRKAIRDFWRERTRTTLVVLAIALGIAAFTALLSSYAILTRELNAGYLATNPASATLRTDAVDDATLAAIEAAGEVSVAEARRSLGGRIRAGSAGWKTLTLFVVRDFGRIRVSTITPQAGAWPPGRGEILIERDAFQVAKTKIGETVHVRTRDGGEATLRVTGSVHDVGQAQARMENSVYGYITTDTLALLGEEPSLDQVKILVARNRFDEAHVRRVAANVRALLEREGHVVRRVDVPVPGKHPHAEIMGLLLLAKASFGLFALVLSGIIVVNLLTALMARQGRQIAVMKAVGGTRRQIAAIYLGQALLLGVAALAIAIPAGLWGGRVLCRAMAVFLNFDITSFAVPAWVFLLVAAIGVLTPLAAAAWPVWKGSAVSVRDALADHGTTSSHFGTTAFDRLLGGTGGLTRPMLLAVRNSFRRRARLVLTVITLAAGGGFFMAALNARTSMINTLDRVFDTKRYDLTVTLPALATAETIDRAVRGTPGVVRAEGWITTEGSIPDGVASKPQAGQHSMARGGGPHGGTAMERNRLTVIARPPRTELLALNIVEGRDLEPGDTDAIVINTALAAKAPQMKVGNIVALQMGHAPLKWRVVGIAREPFHPATAYIPRKTIEDLGGHAGMANSIRVVLAKNDAASIETVKAALDRNLEAEGIRPVGIASKADSRFGFDQHMVMIYVFLVITSGILGGVGGLGLMTTMSLGVLERRREIGVLRTIGATPRGIWLIFLGEGVAVCLLSWALAALTAWPLSRAVGDLLLTLMFKSVLDFSFDLRGLFVWLAVSLLLGAIASILPARHASRGPIREAIEYE